MTQHSHSFNLKAVTRSGLRQGVSLVGGLGFGLLWAQAATATGSFVSDPLLLTPPPQTAPVTPTAAPMAPASVPAAPQLPAPRITVPSVSTPTPLPAASTSSPSEPVGKNSFVDTTSYSGQVTTPPVVLTERASGCSTVVSNGLQSGNCGRVAQPTAIVTAPAPQSAPVSIGSRPSAIAATTSSAVPQREDSSSVPVVSHRIATKSSTIPAPASAPPPQYHRATVELPDNGDTALMFPLSIPATVSSAFGWRIHPIAGVERMHTGTDLAAPMGTPVLAAYSGEVAAADSLGGYGLTVVLRHEEGTQESRYAHLSKILVNLGDWVDQGTVIGLVGNTGYSTGPHLHFEWRHLTNSGWVAVDAGLHLEFAMEQMIHSLEEVAEANID